MGRRHPCARCDPPLVGLELEAELLVEDPQVAVATAHDRTRRDRQHVRANPAYVAVADRERGEAEEAEAVGEMAAGLEVVLERATGAPAAAAAETAATPTEAAAPPAEATAAAPESTAAEAAAAGEA